MSHEPVALGPIEIKHARWLEPGTYTLYRGTYIDGHADALMLADADGEPAATASVNLVDAPPPDGHTWVKTYAENEGLLEDLLASGYVDLGGLFAGAVRDVGHAPEGATLVRLVAPTGGAA